MSRSLRWTIAILLAALLVGGAAFYLASRGIGPRVNVVRGTGEEVVLMDFSRPFALDPLPPGWSHFKFWTRWPMAMSFAEKEGVPALRLETEGTASMLFRYTDVALADYPILAWRWYVEDGIESTKDELARAGDDHPARLFLSLRTEGGEDRRMEIVWGNRVLGRGDYKYIGGFPHYAANGGAGNIGRWHEETVDLAAVYRTIWPDGAPARLMAIALFCDSDETDDRTVAYFAEVSVRRR